VAEAIEESILRALRKISRAIDLYSRKLASRHHLTGPQLVCLSQIARGGATTPSELSREVSLSQATVTGILDRLEAKGLVTRERNPEDKRRVIVQTTRGGRRLAAAAPSPLQETFAFKLRALSEAEQQEIEQTLLRVVEMMEAEELDAAPVLATGPVTAEPAEVVEFLDPDDSASSAGDDPDP